jgi:hypothetical protein
MDLIIVLNLLYFTYQIQQTTVAEDLPIWRFLVQDLGLLLLKMLLINAVIVIIAFTVYDEILSPIIANYLRASQEYTWRCHYHHTAYIPFKLHVCRLLLSPSYEETYYWVYEVLASGFIFAYFACMLWNYYWTVLYKEDDDESKN